MGLKTFFSPLTAMSRTFLHTPQLNAFSNKMYNLFGSVVTVTLTIYESILIIYVPTHMLETRNPHMRWQINIIKVTIVRRNKIQLS